MTETYRLGMHASQQEKEGPLLAFWGGEQRAKGIGGNTGEKWPEVPLLPNAMAMLLLQEGYISARYRAQRVSCATGVLRPR